MKTSPLFTALLATTLFASIAQAATPEREPRTDKTQSQDAAAPASNGAASAQGALAASGQASADAGAATQILAQRYAEAAGSADAAAAIVGELRSGAEGQAMGMGDIDTTLALASNMVAQGDAANLDSAVDAVLDLRAEGLGWGQVAQELGYNLGSTVSAAHSAGAQVGQSVHGTVSSVTSEVSSSVTSGVSASKQIGVNAGTDQGRVRADADTSAAARTRLERPSVDLRGNGRINLGVEARPSLPVVRPLLGR